MLVKPSWVQLLTLAAVVAACRGRGERWWKQPSNSLDLSSQKNGTCQIKIAPPLGTNVVLAGVAFSFTVTLPPFLPNGEPLPPVIYYDVISKDGDFVLPDNQTEAGPFKYSRDGEDGPTYAFEISGTLHSYNHHDVYFNFTLDEDFQQQLCPGHEFRITLMSIPGFLTLLPPILTAVIAIAFRQVLIALLLGIWLCAFFAYKYNPLVATLRTVDKYFVESVADFEHSQIAVFSFFLGGVIGVVQKSGGGLGLAAILRRLTGSRRKASIACIILGTMIFFDDYSLVLIAGTSLRTMMDTANVSKEKFAYILKSLGPTLPSMVPISSWIGVQVGNLQMALNSQFCKSCDNIHSDAFVMTVSTLPYRFFPILLIFTILLIAIFNRDFGPMLRAERAAMPSPVINNTPPSRSREKRKEEERTGMSGKLCPNGGGESGVGSDSENERVELHGAFSNNGSLAEIEPEEITGPLAPKKGVKYRWFNAVIPFLVVMVFTLLGMVLDGYFKLKEMPVDDRPSITVINIFTKADSVAALIWASVLACVVAMVMLLVQRILTLDEYMSSWMEGVKDIIEPYMVLWLAWALGAAIQDIQTTNFLAKALSDGGLDAKWIPAIVTVMGFLMSFAAGSAFGTMGIIFPLVIPTVCQISKCNANDVLQSSAAIFSSSIFGNVISPIAGICILTVFASRCPLERHIKSAALYSVLIAAVSTLFATLPVGAGWYPWYEGWIAMFIIISVIFVLFSTDTDNLDSQPLLIRLFPGLSVFLSRAISSLIERCQCKERCRLMCSCCRRKKRLQVYSEYSEEQTNLLS